MVLYCFSEATTGFEPVIRALQAPALPLGHAAQAELLHAVEEAGDGPMLRVAGVPRRLPEL